MSVGLSTVAAVLDALAVLAGRVQPAGLLLGVPLALAGLVALSGGNRHRRVLAVVGLAAVGALAAWTLRARLAAHLGLGPGVAAAGLAIAGAAVGVALPGSFPFAAAALPGALAGGTVPLAGRAELGAAAAGLLAGLVGLGFARVVTALAASFGGALALGLGLLACFPAAPLARELAARPAALAGFVIVLGIAGAALQLARPAAPARSPEDPAARSPGSPP